MAWNNSVSISSPISFPGCGTNQSVRARLGRKSLSCLCFISGALIMKFKIQIGAAQYNEVSMQERQISTSYVIFINSATVKIQWKQNLVINRATHTRTHRRTRTYSLLLGGSAGRWLTVVDYVYTFISHQGAVSIRKTVLPGMAIPMLKIRRPNGRLIVNMEIAIRR